MAKKLIKINNPKHKDLERFIGEQVSLVLNNQSVYLGRINKLKISEVIFSDNLNNKRFFSIDDIVELIVDELHSF